MKDFLCLEGPFLDLVSQTPRPRCRGRPLFADLWYVFPSPYFSTPHLFFSEVLRGPVAILVISRDTRSDSIAKLFRASFCGYRTIIARYVAKWGIAQMCLCETKYQGGIAPFWESADLPEKASRDTGYRSDSIAASRDMGPLS